jgi:thioesterase domain-containing protein/acyl carrier protein
MLRAPYPQCIVSTIDFGKRYQEELVRRQQSNEVDVTGSKSQSISKHQRPDLGYPYTAPENEMQKKLATVWQELIGVESIGIHDDFFDLGGHSLLAIRMITEIKRVFGQSVAMESLLQGASISKLSSALQNRNGNETWSPLVPLQTETSGKPFFCVPGAGGTVVYLYQFARSMGEHVPFYGLQAKGLDGKTLPDVSVEEMAERYIKAIQTVQPVGPYFIGGHSFGAKIAFEMCQQLSKAGHEIGVLAVFDTTAPSAPTIPVGLDWDNARWLIEIVNIIRNLAGIDIPVQYEELSTLSTDEQFQKIHEHVARLNWFPSEGGMDHLKGLMNVYKACHQTTYIPQEPVHPVKVILYRPESLPEVTLENTASTELYKLLTDPVYGGDHLTMMIQPQVQQISDHLAEVIRAIQECRV